MATFYFNAAVDGDWQTLGNWWMSYNAGTDTHSVPATALPTSTDSVQVRGNIDGNSGSEPTVVNASFFGTAYTVISITVTGLCTFNDSSYADGGSFGVTITGNCTFNDSSYNYATINGNCTFNGDSYHDGASGIAVINGNATFTNSSYARDPLEDYAASVVTGTVTFSSPTPVTFTLGSGSSGWFSDTTDWVFTAPGPSWLFDGGGVELRSTGVINGNATFDNYAVNYGVINGNATFLNGGSNGWSGDGIVNGNATFTNAYSNGTVNGNATFYGTSNHTNGVTPATINGSATFNDYSFTEARIVGHATFNDFSYNNAGWETSVVDGDATFNDNSTNGGIFGGTGIVTGDAVFNDTATCGGDPDLNNWYFGSLGIVEGTARFTLSAAASQMSAARLAEFGSLELIYDKGINGSSILGVV